VALTPVGEIHRPSEYETITRRDDDLVAGAGMRIGRNVELDCHVTGEHDESHKQRTQGGASPDPSVEASHHALRLVRTVRWDG
jgi:hypothetical protein